MDQNECKYCKPINGYAPRFRVEWTQKIGQYDQTVDWIQATHCPKCGKRLEAQHGKS